MFCCQGKDRQKKKRGTKAIRIDAEGDASLEDLANIGSQGYEPVPEADNGKAANKKVFQLPKVS